MIIVLGVIGALIGDRDPAAVTAEGTPTRSATPTPSSTPTPTITPTASANPTPHKQVSTRKAKPRKPKPPAVGWLPVTRVVDGDTVEVQRNGTPVTLRLIGIDTPETV
ncbi:MAG: thermonuclease family protein, partial [Actinopolymorphaceae bacterium]